MKRGVGYCADRECEDYLKGTFLLNHGGRFFCPRCRIEGTLEKEHGIHTGKSEYFKEVRVEFNFDPLRGVYHDVAVVRDEALWGAHNTYTLYSPLIRTEKRALRVAENILANLQHYNGVVEEVPRTTETVISMDSTLSEFKSKLQIVKSTWEGLRSNKPSK